MARIAVNALSLRPGGGLQVIAGLLSRFNTNHHYTILWSDPMSRDQLQRMLTKHKHIDYIRPLNTSRSADLFLWQLTRMSGWLKSNEIGLCLGVNHHFDCGEIPQVIYHLNTLRFDRAARPIWAAGEVADRLRDWRARTALKQAEANVFESQYLMGLAQTKSSTIRNANVIYIGLEDGLARVVFDTPAPSPDPHIFAITSPQPHKDNPLLIHMLAELTKRRPEVPWRLKIAGGREPDSFDDLKSLASDLNVEDQIDWLGFRQHDEMAKIGHKCLCLVSTSRAESFCMVALEAMSWGCPAIVTNLTSMPESVGNAGIVLDAGNESTFADAVISFYDNPEYRTEMATRGLEWSSKTTWSDAAAQFERLF